MKDTYDFGEALKRLKKGISVQRTGWNGKGMYIYIEIFGVVNGAIMEPCFVMFTANQTHQPGWLASQADMLSEDWQDAA